MKINTITFISLCTIIHLFSCAGGKNKDYNLQEKAPFTITKASYQDWIAGVKGAGSGTNVSFTIEDLDPTIKIIAVYFKKSKSNVHKVEPNNYRASFKNNLNREGGDIILDIDPLKEVANKVPETIPFTLANNEAVVSYAKNDGEEKYVKISNLKQQPVLALPSANDNYGIKRN